MKKITSILSINISLLFFIATSVNAQTVNKDFVDGKLWLKLKADQPIPVTTGPTSSEVSLTELPTISRIASPYQLKSISAPFHKSGSAVISRIVSIEFGDHNKVDELLSLLERSGIAEYVEKAPVYTLSLTPNDASYGSQYALPLINAPAAWNISTGNPSIVVAITDNAMQSNHPDLTGNMWVNPGEIANNSLDDDGNGYIDDVNGYDVADGDNNFNPVNSTYDHGTHTAGIAGAKSNNSIGVASIGFNIKIMFVKITKNSSSNTAVDDPVEGIYYAALNRARVISCSWGTTGFSATIQAMVDWAYNSRGCIIVGAAGNAGTNIKEYPGAMNNVVCVAATDAADKKSSYSQYGTWVDVSAPGDNILSTIPGSAYGSISGTSMSTPMVSGLLGLILSVNPNLTQAQAINCLLSTAVNINGLNPSYVGMLGTGRINALAAVQCAQATVFALDASLTDVTEGTVCSLTPTMQVVLRNAGTTSLSTVNINYKIDNNTPSVYNWSGTLASGASVVVNLPTVTFTYGTHNFTSYTSSPNGGTDGTKTNDTTKAVIKVLQNGLALPLVEGFEGAFIPSGWELSNADGEITWVQTTAAKFSGTKSASIDNYNDPFIRTFDYILTPLLDMSTATSTTLTFQVAYQPVASSVTDTMLVYASSDCGATFNVIYKKWGTALATVAGNNINPFVPTGTTQWRKETVNITGALLTSKTAFFAFANSGNSGNNLYIDDINISGTITTGIDAEEATPSIAVYPNPNNGSFNLTTENLPAGSYTVELLNIMGQQIYSKTIERNGGVFTEAMLLNNASKGVYLVKITGEKGSWTNRFIVE